ncbi:hypothetical protein K438DRAFT_399089 [Mycena galopus ATCC 62051]|nr:hypothetical protein K438DRAFT_399089 [Mycena galopus ATCC 62051]
MPSTPSFSSQLSSDVLALTNALAQISVQSSKPTSQKSSFKPQDDGHRMYPHIATLLTRDGMDDAQEDIAFACVSMYRHFAVFAVHQSPSPESTLASSPVHDEDPLTSENITQAGIPAQTLPSQCTKIRFESLTDPQSPTSQNTVEAVLKTGLTAVDVNQHVSDVKQILLGFSAYDLPEDDREERQTRCFVFFLQRSIEKLTQRFHNPRAFFSTQYAPWWRIFTEWDPNPGHFPVREFNLRYHITLIFNALSPGLLSYTQPLMLDCDTAVKCVNGLAVLLDVIDGKLLACQESTRSGEDWDRLNTTLRMLYSLLYETEVIRHIFFSSSLSAHILSLSSAQYGENGSDDGQKRDGPFLFRQLQKIVAWHRGLFMVASTKVVRAAIPIHFNLISVPPLSVEVTPIMNLVNEIYHSKRHRTLIRSYLACRGVFSHDSKAFSPHYDASLMGILMAADHHEYSDLFAEDVASDPRTIREMKDGILQVISTGKRCCYTCKKLASLLAIDASSPADSTIFCGGAFRPWSPPFGITEEVLTILRNDLMDLFKCHLECVIIQDKTMGSKRPAKCTEYKPGQLAVSKIIKTLNEIFPDGL